MDVGASSSNIEFKGPEQVVNYMGSSWIIRRSKSHNGMLYFFNTVTKEAVWNLNDAEIEKAKKLTKSLGNQMENIECPEPKEPPMSHRHESYGASQQIPLSRVYNKQIINNQMQQPFAYFPSACTQVLPYGSVPLGLNVSGTAYNSNIWAVPPLFMTPSSPVIQQAHTSANVTYNDQDYKVPVQSTSKLLSNRFPPHCEAHETRKKFTPNNMLKSPLKRNNFQRDHKQYFVPRNYRQRLSNNDLRNVLSARKTHNNFKNMSRKSEELVNETAFGDQCSFEESNNIFESNKNFEEICQASYLSDVDVDILEDKRKRITLDLDFTKLKQLAGSNTNPEQWYIVADQSILLNHLNFLDILINSDERCKLMVPREIMDELRVAARTSCGMPRSTNRSRRAVLFVSELLKSGRCLLGEPSQDSTVRNCHILRCCSNLTQQNYHVVLLTNDEELQEIKRLLSIPIFTIKEIKKFLTVTSAVTENNHEASVDLTEKIVKITIANDLMTSPIQVTSEIINRNEQAPDDNICKYQNNDVSLNNIESSDLSAKEEIQSQPNIKKTVDAAVQTESSPETTLIQIDQPTTTTLTSSPPQPNVQKSVSTVLSSDTQNSTMTSQCEPLLKKERRLVRSTSHQTTINQSNNTEASHSSFEKKQFKWRKRRNIIKTNADVAQLTTFDYSHLDNSNEDSLNADIDASSVSREGNQSIQNTESINQAINTLCDSIVEESETSSVIIHRNINEKIVIEETSTSGVISNTTSHADSESESVKQHEVTCDEEEMRQNIMFNVIDRIMEQSLRMRCDEWVSRFVQIMEEALTQLLQRDHRILQNVMPPPWTLYEAAHCIKITFRGNHEVVNASSRLLNVLDTVSDGGRIKLDLNPQDYMEMYSYGVYLIDILQSTSLNCEDIQTASDSLSNLLNDIRNPTVDVHNDTFCENKHLESHKKPSPTEIQDDTHQGIIGVEVQPKSQPKDLVNDVQIYNLRSNDKKSDQANKQQTREQNKVTPKKSEDVSFMKNIDIKCNFFTSLHLQEKILSKKDGNVSSDPYINRQTCESQANDFNEYHQKECDNGHLDSKDNNFKTSNLKIVRTFNKCPEFEEKLRNKNREILDMDQLDYSEDIAENYDFMDDDYYSEEECYNGELVHNEAVNVDAESTNLAITKPSGNTERSKLDINANDNFPSIFSRLFLEIKEAFLKVQSFCKETENELSGTQYTFSRKIEILQNVEKAYSYIDHLRETLNSVLYRETCTGSNNIQFVLKQVGLNKVNDILLGEYRMTISKCMDQAKVLLDSLDIIKSAVKT